MSAAEPVAGTAGPRRPAPGARREYLLTLLAGAVGAAVVLLAARQDWARVVTIEPHPLPASRVAVRGQDLVPAAGALGLAALAGLAAVLATRGLVRRIVGGLLAVFGVVIIASVSLPVTAAQIRGAALGATTAQAGSVPGGSTVGSGTTPGTSGSGVAGLSLASHVEMAAFPWRWAVLFGGLRSLRRQQGRPALSLGVPSRPMVAPCRRGVVLDLGFGKARDRAGARLLPGRRHGTRNRLRRGLCRG